MISTSGIDMYISLAQKCVLGCQISDRLNFLLKNNIRNLSKLLILFLGI